VADRAEPDATPVRVATGRRPGLRAHGHRHRRRRGPGLVAEPRWRRAPVPPDEWTPARGVRPGEPLRGGLACGRCRADRGRARREAERAARPIAHRRSRREAPRGRARRGSGGATLPVDPARGIGIRHLGVGRLRLRKLTGWVGGSRPRRGHAARRWRRGWWRRGFELAHTVERPEPVALTGADHVARSGTVTDPAPVAGPRANDGADVDREPMQEPAAELAGRSLQGYLVEDTRARACITPGREGSSAPSSARSRARSLRTPRPCRRGETPRDRRSSGYVYGPRPATRRARS
jgi:hypothetical protein